MTLAQERERYIQALLLPFVREQVALDDSIRSVLFTVAQYWDDNASDQVHMDALFSTQSQPIWPHDCDWGDVPTNNGTSCQRCRQNGEEVDPPYEPAFFRAWESMCREGADQNLDTHQNHLPAVLVQINGDNLSHQIVGRFVRPWLEEQVPNQALQGLAQRLVQVALARPNDMTPRKVLADVLLTDGMPWGELITRQMGHKEVSQDLFAACERQIVGPLQQFVSWQGIGIKNGFLHAATVYWPGDGSFHDHQDSPWWSTVRQYRVHKTCTVGRVPLGARLELPWLSLERAEHVAACRADDFIGLKRLDLPHIDEAMERQLLHAPDWPDLVELGTISRTDPDTIRRIALELPIQRVWLKAKWDPLTPWLERFRAGDLPPELVIVDQFERSTVQIRLTRNPAGVVRLRREQRAGSSMDTWPFDRATREIDLTTADSGEMSPDGLWFTPTRLL
jgi:hypothetical protein